MNTNLKFAVWCVEKCLPLWDPPEEIFAWLNDPENKEEAMAVIAEIQLPSYIAAEPIKSMATWATWVAVEAAYYQWEFVPSSYTARALRTTSNELKHEFVSTWTDEELKTNDPEWIEYATAEIFKR